MPSPSPLILLPLLLFVPALSQAPEIPCYAPDGFTRADDTYRPCNNLGLRTRPGAASSCCRLNTDPLDRDVCDASGLCLRRGVVRRGFCTDASWTDPACVRVCTTNEGGSSNETVKLTPCGDGTVCCGPDSTCCGTSAAFRPPFNNNAPLPAGEPRNMKPVYFGVGGMLITALVIALGVVACLARRVGILRRRNGELLSAAASKGSEAQALPPLSLVEKPPVLPPLSRMEKKPVPPRKPRSSRAQGGPRTRRATKTPDPPPSPHVTWVPMLPPTPHVASMQELADYETAYTAIQEKRIEEARMPEPLDAVKEGEGEDEMGGSTTGGSHLSEKTIVAESEGEKGEDVLREETNESDWGDVARLFREGWL